MKNSFLYISAMLLALAGCSRIQEEAVETPGEEVVTITPVSTKSIVVNTAIPDTKVNISPEGDDYKMSWDGDETAKLVERSDAAANATLYTSSDIDVTDGKAAFTFDGLTPVAETTVYNYDILYPESAVGAATGNVITMTLPASQTPTALSADPAAALLAGRNTTDFSDQPASVNANFSHLAAYGKMTLKNLSRGSLETVTSISITIEAEECNIAGDLEYNAETGVADYNSSSGSVITINGTNLTWVYGGFDVWFACKPFTLPSGKKLIVTTTLNGTLVQTATMVAKNEVVFDAGTVTEFPAFGTTYTITFNTQGGSAIAPAYVGRGNKAKQPTNPTKTGALAKGVYLGDYPDPTMVDFTFGGWYTDSECTSPYNFNEAVYVNKTLYAKWLPEKLSIDIARDNDIWNSGEQTVYQGIQYVNDQTLGEETHYTIVMQNNDEKLFNESKLALNNENAVIRIVGLLSGEKASFDCNNNRIYIKITSGKLILGKNIIAKMAFGGTGWEADPMFDVNGATGTLVIEEGCRLDGSTLKSHLLRASVSGAQIIMNGGSISSNSNNSSGDFINLSDGTSFIINGGTISGNTLQGRMLGPKVGVASEMNGGSIDNNVFGDYLITVMSGNATFIMNNGSITNNTGTTTGSGATIGCNWGIFTMNGGEISNNSVTTSSATGHVGGGVLYGGNYSGADHSFVKTGGTITDNAAYRSVTSTTGQKGQQVVYYGQNKKIDANIDSSTNVSSSNKDSAPWIASSPE